MRIYGWIACCWVFFCAIQLHAQQLVWEKTDFLQYPKNEKNLFSTIACTVTPNAGTDITVCPGSFPVQLDGSISGNYSSFTWSPIANISDPSILNPTVSGPGTYTLTAQGLGTNLVTNGDFENGNTGFDTDYTHSTSGSDWGYYNVSNDPNNLTHFFSDCVDHTSGSGNLMTVDGHVFPDQDLWCQTINVTPNTNYQFSLWATMVGGSNPPELMFFADGVAITVPSLSIPMDTCLWTELSTVWNSGTTTSVEICIQNENLASFGNDFAIDDIGMYELCENTSQVVVSELLIDVDIAAASIDCPDDCVTLDASGSSQGAGFSYAWTASNGGSISSGATTLGPEVCGVGTYQLVVTYDMNGMSCSDSTSISITNQNDLPAVPTFMGPAVVCEGDTVNYFITSNNPPTDGFMWTITGGNNLTGQSTSIDVEWSATGTEICVYATNNCGDSDPTCLTITVNNLPDDPVITGDPSICNTTVGTYSVPTDPTIDSYTWTVPSGATISTGQNSESVEVDWGTTGGGQVCLEVTNDCGPASDCFDVTIGAIQSDVIVIQPLCNDSTGSATASGSDGLAPYSFEWDDGTMTDMISGLTEGTYYVTVSDADGCTALDSAIIIEPLEIDIDFTSTPISCNDVCDGTIDVTVTGGTSPYTYAWTGSTETTPNLIDLCANTYTVTVTDANNCTATAEVILDNPPAITASLIDDITICLGDAATFTLQLEGVGPFDVTLSDGTILTNVNDGDTGSISPTMTTTLTITDIVDQGQLGCTGTIGTGITITVDSPPNAPLITGDSTLCDGETITYCVSNDPNVTTWTWTIPADATMTGQGTNCIDVNWTGSAGGQVCLEAINDCDSEQECIDVTVHPIPTADFTVDPIICVTDSTTVTYTGSASANATYTWNFNGGNILSGSGAGPYEINWATAGTYNITLTVEENGCTSTTITQSVQVDAEIPPVVINCTSTTSSITFEWDAVPGGDVYTAININGLPGTQTGNSYTVDSLAAGQWISVEVTVSGTSICGDVTTEITCVALACPNITADIDSVAAICLDGNNIPFDLTANITGGNGMGTSTWIGNGITNASTGTFDPTIAGAGTHNITYTYDENGCIGNAAVTITVYDLPTANFTVDPIICLTDSTIVTYTGTASTGAIYTWDFDGGNILSGSGAGPYEIEWTNAGTYNITLTVEENGCTSSTETQMVQVDAAIPTFAVSCSSTPTSVTFTWDAVAGATGYSINNVNGPAGTLTGTSYEVTGLSVGQEIIIEVTAEGTSACGNTTVTANCSADNCPTITIDVTDVSDLCLDGNALPFDLNATVTGSDGSGVGTWSGDGITDTTLGTFDPATAGVGTHTITYSFEEINCTYADSIDVTVNANPTANFTMDAIICESDFATITYTGTANTNAIYTWDFDGGNILSGTDAGPYEIEWMDAGIYNITLTVEENGCTSSTETQMIQVDAEIPSFTINCNSTPTSITFTWNSVAGATSYSINDVNGPAGILTDTTYTVTGLSVGQSVTIEVTAEGTSACGNTTETATCSADNCPMITVDVAAVTAMCLDANALPFDMMSTVTGSDGSGVGTWSGDGITDAALGTFDPVMAGVGIHTITYTFEEVNCTYTGMTDVIINAIPTSDFTANAVICENDFATITYTGTASTGAIYTWDFDGGNVLSGTDAGPYEIEWMNAGSYNITLTVEENGCTSATTTQMIQVDAVIPDFTINCSSTPTSITYTWNAVAGATSYSINDIDGPVGILTDTTYTVTGLSVGQSVTIEVTAEGTSVCGNTTIPATCSADNCPTITVDVAAVTAMCLDVNALPFDMMSTVTGSDGSGVGTWSGDGITDTTLGTFDPSGAGVGTHTITYTFEEINCTYTGMTNITIYEVPTADFNVDAVICENDFATITYIGTASTGAIYTWDFDGGNILSGSGAGPYEVEWVDTGNYNIILTVEENGCISQSNSLSIQVDAVIPDFTINCNSTTSSVIFTWDAVPGATNYSINDLGGPTGTLTGTSYEVTGLSIGQTVMIEVTAEGTSVCGNTTIPATCSADNCPTITAEVDEVTAMCLDNNAIPFDMTVTVTGSDGSGVGSWSGDGITDTTLGTFDPVTAGVGVHTITYTFEEVNCTYTDMTDVIIYAVPTADFSVDAVICENSFTTITYTGTASSSAIFTWDFDGGNIISGLGAGPYEVEWTNSGIYNITLTVEENGCISQNNSQPVQVDVVIPEVEVDCNSTTNSVIFSWDNVAGADSYSVIDISGPPGTMIGNTYEVTGLATGQAVTIEITAEGTSICGNTTISTTCSADNCPSIDVMISPVADICLYPNTPTIQLENTITGSDGSGSGSWSGDGVTNGIFNPFDAGVGIHNITYTFSELLCDFTETISINVFEVPQAEAGDNQLLSCADPMVMLNGSSSIVGNYNWTTTDGSIFSGQNSLTPEVDAPGTYILTVENNGCFTKDSIVVDEDTSFPVGDAGAQQTITCDVTCITLGGAGTSEGPQYNYSWTGPNGFISNEKNPEVCVGGEYILTVSHNQFACVATPSSVMILENNTLPQAEILPFGNLDCITTAILLDGSTSSTGSEFAYQWYDNNGIINNATTPVYEAFVEGNYTLMITNTTSGCTASSSAEVDDLVAYPDVVIEQPEILTCAVPMILLDGTGSTNSPQVNYLWTGPNGGIDSGETTATPQVILPGVYTLTLIDATNGCQTSETITVNQNIDAPIADAGIDIDLDCNDFNALLGGNNTSTGSIFTYSWTSDNPNASFNDATVIDPVVVGLGTFTLTVTNTVNGCTATDEMTILQSTNIPTDVVYDILESRCYGDDDAAIIINEVIGGTGPYLYSVDESPYASSNIFNDLEPGDYHIIIQDANGCELPMTVPITEPEEVTLDLGENIYVELGDSITLDPQMTGDISIIDWTPEDIFENCIDGVNCFDPLLYPTGQVSISATVMDDNGCRATDFVTIFVSKKRYVYIPNAFSPDGEDDPANETFMIYTGKGVEKVNMFRVFTRWGELVHEASDFVAGDSKDGWDGYFKGQMMNPGVYVYMAEIEFSDGTSEVFRGDVTLMR